MTGAKVPLRPRHVWAKLQAEGRKRDLTLFNLAVDSKLLGTAATSLQPVPMIARNRDFLSGEQYTKAITDLADIGQEFISVDSPALAEARKLDRDSAEECVGRRS